MGSTCCKRKDESPRVSLSKVFARWPHRLFRGSSHTVKIADLEKSRVEAFGSYCNPRPSVSEPTFISSTNEDRNHVTLFTEAPTAPPRKKKPRLSKKRVSFQSDVDIMRMSSSKSLDAFSFDDAMGESRPRSKSLDSFFDPRREVVKDFFSFKAEKPVLPDRRTSSLDQLPACPDDDIVAWAAKIKKDVMGKLKIKTKDNEEDTRLTAKLRRDTLGNALDFHGYRRPVMESSLVEHLEEECDESTEDISSALSAKIRRDTLAVISKTESPKESLGELEEETESSIEDLTDSQLPLKLRRDTLGVALTARPSSMGSSYGSLLEEDSIYHSTELDFPKSLQEETESSTEDLEKKVNCSKLCSKLRRDTFGDALREAVHCKACSSFEDITELEIDDPKAGIDKRKAAWLNNILKEGESWDDLSGSTDINTPSPPPEEKTSTSAAASRTEQNNNIPQAEKPFTRVTFTDQDISTALNKIRSNSKVEPKEPYTLVYISPKTDKPPEDKKIPTIKVSSAEETSRKSSITDSLHEFETSIYDMLQASHCSDEESKHVQPVST